MGIADFVTEERIIPGQVPSDRLGVRVQHQLAGIESVTFRRLIGAVDSIAIELIRLDAGQVSMPNLLRLFSQKNVRLTLACGFGRIEKAKLDLGRVLGKQRS